ncbi:tonB-system energizer ExbB [Rhodoblastus acidophilus]|uniref:Biopolymer transport protein ExbB n=1 Tax=Candidatus Rhodoblastus alkanivorans TaxID=2954117 RepID=A0ABS9Z8P6_9HYPH|nr:tonB-system energizer ExbB [Candidatus Rhodoblastus alkanivorans]MCI4678592.1 tonB-system energizer ExbB [Candidatus Rhodoblastus alkanivorans]MCI4683002.1 tonB-system energizer ExbB [Candidatus Rhodoblastus alkanivorans]MDI4640312.1 tonB-system energizer ExbB [Rhodoblastus acidophilus]
MAVALALAGGAFFGAAALALPANPPSPEAPELARASLLPDGLSPWSMFLSAHIVVKAVMVLLVLASLVTWTVAIAKGLELWSGKRAVKRQCRLLARSWSLAEANDALAGQGRLDEATRAALEEIALSQGVRDKGAIKERIASRLERIEAGLGRRMGASAGALATIGSISPFVGLFGTVWGIMNSFIGISQQHTTNLAVVAPGIAEALLATAMGLVAAIPAVAIYNAFSRGLASYRALCADGSAEILRLASRDLDRAEQALPFPRPVDAAAE